jgi:hypothetical protein
MTTKLPMPIKYTQWSYNIPNYQNIYQRFPFQGSLKYTQIGIFGLKRNHLATWPLAGKLKGFGPKRKCKEKQGPILRTRVKTSKKLQRNQYHGALVK